MITCFFLTNRILPNIPQYYPILPKITQYYPIFPTGKANPVVAVYGSCSCVHICVTKLSAELDDKRTEFIADFSLKTMKLKGDKFQKMYSLKENKQAFMDFFDKPDVLQLVVCQAPGGGLATTNDWPTTLKTTACYFVHKGREAVAKDARMRNQILYGDLSYSPIDQLSAFVDEVSCVMACVCVINRIV